jgi:DNA polymerase-3 subunit gamma/tau
MANQESYLVLSRKWRPQRFADVIGQEHVTRTLRNAIRLERIAHAYLFSGPRGTGKTTTARILAKALNCADGPREEPCNECPSCRQITGGRSLDVVEIDGASNRGIEEIRELREQVKYVSAGSRFKLYIIDEVHMLTEHAFNALLKTLEEPPAQVIFVFATTEPHEIPLTILSRCQRFDFRRVRVAEVTARLQRILSQESIELAPEVLALVARKSGGSVRDAESLLDQLLSFGAESLNVEEARGILGLVADDLFPETLRIISRHDSKAALELVEQITDRGYDLQEYASGLLNAFRTVLLLQSGVTRIEGLSDHEADSYRKAGEGFTSADLLRVVRILTELEFALKHTAHPQILLETTLVRLAQLDTAVQIQELLALVRGWRRGGPEDVREAGGCARSSDRGRASASGEPPADGKAVSGEQKQRLAVACAEVSDQWDGIVERVKRQRMAVGVSLEFGKPVEFEKGTLVIAFPASSGFQKEQVEGATARKIIESELAATLGIPVRIRCRCDERVSAPGAQDSRSEGRDEKTMRILEIFDGDGR